MWVMRQNHFQQLSTFPAFAYRTQSACHPISRTETRIADPSDHADKLGAAAQYFARDFFLGEGGPLPWICLHF